MAAEAHEALVREAEKSAAFKARIEEAAHRGLAMRERVRPRPMTTEDELARVFAASAPISAELAKRIEARS